MRNRVQKHDEHVLAAPFRDDFAGREEPDIYEILECARPYLPREGAFGEMVLNVGKVVYLAKKGAAGIIDISPFTCMNGIVCEAIYPRISRDLGGIPIRNFYFDGTQSDFDRDLGVYMEFARTYQRRTGLRPVPPGSIQATHQETGRRPVLRHYPIRGGGQGIGDEIGSVIRRPLAIPAIDQHGKDARGGAAIDIAPAVADQEALPQVHRVPRRGIQHHPGFGLAA